VREKRAKKKEGRSVSRGCKNHRGMKREKLWAVSGGWVRLIDRFV
jgi:hypothetical protein